MKPGKRHVDVSATVSIFESRKPSKRTLLKAASSIYDPLNFVIPISLAFKMQLQQLWIRKVDWDSPLEGEDLLTYNENFKRLKNVAAINLQRNYCPVIGRGES